MSHKNLSTATTDLIASYGNTARNLVHAYRVGNKRFAHYLDQRWEKALAQSASQLSNEVRKNALSAQRTVSGMYIKGITVTSDGADGVVNKVVELAGKSVLQVAGKSDQFEKRTGINTFNTLAKAAAPAVVAVADLAGKLEQGSVQLANTVAGKTTAVKVAGVKRVTPRRKAATAGKAPRKPRASS